MNSQAISTLDLVMLLHCSIYGLGMPPLVGGGVAELGKGKQLGEMERG